MFGDKTIVGLQLTCMKHRIDCEAFGELVTNEEDWLDADPISCEECEGQLVLLCLWPYKAAARVVSTVGEVRQGVNQVLQMDCLAQV